MSDTHTHTHTRARQNRHSLTCATKVMYQVRVYIDSFNPIIFMVSLALNEHRRVRADEGIGIDFNYV